MKYIIDLSPPSPSLPLLLARRRRHACISNQNETSRSVVDSLWFLWWLRPWIIGESYIWGPGSCFAMSVGLSERSQGVRRIRNHMKLLVRWGIFPCESPCDRRSKPLTAWEYREARNILDIAINSTCGLWDMQSLAVAAPICYFVCLAG